MKLYLLMVLFIFVQDCDLIYLLKMVLQCLFTEMKSGHCSHSLCRFAYEDFLLQKNCSGSLNRAENVHSKKADMRKTT